MRSFLILAVCMLAAGVAQASDTTITLKDDGFSPANLVIAADKKVEITVKNATAKSMEFESDDLDREKVIPAGKDAKITVGPLKAGSYSYFNEFHEDSKGTITAK